MLALIYRAADALRRRAHPGDHGRLGEDIAHRYLRRQGCTVVARNYRPRSGGGEIDVIAWHGSQLAFVEVKTRQSVAHGDPEGAVDRDKRVHLAYAAREYSRRSGVAWDQVRFDIVSVVLAPYSVEWHRDAFRL